MTETVVTNPITGTTVANDGVPHSGQMTITPAQATRILTERNLHNRRASPVVVARYARDMKAGNWLLNGDSIRFGVDGTLLDGQHRLMAIVKADVDVRTFVVWNLPLEAQDTMDDGRKRTMANVLELDDTAIPRAKTLASILRRAVLMDKGVVDGSGGGSAAPTKTEMKDRYFAEVAAFDRASAVADEVRNARGIRCAASTIGLAYYACAKRSQVDADVFFAKLKTGVGLTEGDPVLVLRNRLALDGSTRLATESAEVLAWFFRAWNAHRAGKSIKILRQKVGDRFPEPK